MQSQFEKVRPLKVKLLSECTFSTTVSFLNDRHQALKARTPSVQKISRIKMHQDVNNPEPTTMTQSGTLPEQIRRLPGVRTLAEPKSFLCEQHQGLIMLTLIVRNSLMPTCFPGVGSPGQTQQILNVKSFEPR
jgi:hypothetical protein